MTAPHRRRAQGSKTAGKAGRKRQLLACAKQLFVTNGYHNTTTEQIAQAAEVSEAQVNRQLGDKRMAFLEVLTDVRRQTLERWQDELAELTDPLVKLHFLADRFLGTVDELSPEFRLLHRALAETEDEAVLAYLRDYFEDLETLLADVIREGQKAGVCRRSLDPQVGARQLLHTFLGHTLALPLNLNLPADDYLSQAVDCLMHCILKTDI